MYTEQNDKLKFTKNVFLFFKKSFHHRVNQSLTFLLRIEENYARFGYLVVLRELFNF